MERRAHHKLEVWKDSIELVAQIYEVTEKFPSAERYGLVSQLRRAAVSIPSNIAEGAARGGNKEFIHFLNVANGSLSELETQIIIAKKLNYLAITDDLFDMLDKVTKMLLGLRNKLQKENS